MDSEDKTKKTYLTFRLGEEMFAATIEKASAILEVLPITKVPRSPDYMKGVINVRGEVMPVVDTRLKFGMTPVEYTKNTVIITFNVEIDGEKSAVAALVDEPGTVLEIENSDISPPPHIGAKYKSELVIGTSKVDDIFLMILDIDKVFSLDELLEIKEKTDESEEESEEESGKK